MLPGAQTAAGHHPGPAVSVAHHQQTDGQVHCQVGSGWETVKEGNNEGDSVSRRRH